MSEPSPESIAFSKLTIGIHSLAFNKDKKMGEWLTGSVTENGSTI